MLGSSLGERQRKALCCSPGSFLVFRCLLSVDHWDGRMLRLLLLPVVVFTIHPQVSQTEGDLYMNGSPSVL